MQSPTLTTPTPKLGAISLVVIDCDGVLTDGQLLVDASGNEVKRFALRDRHGIELAVEHGLRIALLTRAASESVVAQARSLGIAYIRAAADKLEGLRSLCNELNVPLARTAFVASDVFDLGAMRLAGVSIAVANAHPRVIARADVVTQARGGEGALREVVDLWLRQRSDGRHSRIAETLRQQRTYVIAEIGQNHQGDPKIARELVQTAKLCGVDAVKSQKRDIATLLSKEEYARPYDSPHAFGATYGAHREALELSAQAYGELFAYADELSLDFFASPWDIPSARLLRDLGCPLFKIPSAALTNLPLLREIASYERPVILSTGMSELAEIDAAVEVLSQTELYILQCTSAYPLNFDHVNLRAMHTLHERYQRPVGLSGHHKGIAVDAAAVALGAQIIERHFTLDRTWKGTDHAASLEPPGLARLVRDIRAVEVSLGSGEKCVEECELPARRKLRGALQVVAEPSVAASRGG